MNPRDCRRRPWLPCPRSTSSRLWRDRARPEPEDSDRLTARLGAASRAEPAAQAEAEAAEAESAVAVAAAAEAAEAAEAEAAEAEAAEAAERFRQQDHKELLDTHKALLNRWDHMH